MTRKEKFFRVAKAGGRFVLSAAMLTICISGLIRLFNVVTGLEIPPGTAATAVPIMLVMEIGEARKRNEKSIVLGI